MGGSSSKLDNEEAAHKFLPTPESTMVYGAGWRGHRRTQSESGFTGTPCAMAKTTLPLDVQEYLLTASFPRIATDAAEEGDEKQDDEDRGIFTCSGDKLLELGFARCVDYPQLREHVYYEGYFHSLRQSQAVQSLNPRRGYPFDKPAAPVQLRAFYTAFRETNRAAFETAIGRLNGLSTSTEAITPADKDAVDSLARLFDPDGASLLGDLAIQVHCGTAVEDPNVGWHTDAINSLFHLATSIHGSRKLYSFLQREQTLPDYIDWSPFCDDLQQGDVYVSSPAFFRHGVGYPAEDWSRRTIAIQARFLLTEEDFSKLRTVESDAIREQIATIIAELICSGFHWPSLADIKQVESQLSHYEGDLVLKRNLDETKTSGYNAY